ncbi:MAG: glycosyltransferase family 10 domain-containing protein, partial [Hyphomicrobiales bacterium]
LIQSNKKLRVKLMAKNLKDTVNPVWRKQLDLSRFGPAGSGPVEFTLDPDDRNYDWLVVYDEIPKLPVAPAGTSQSFRQSEVLNCPPANCILVTSEPSTIKIHGKRYLSQFGHVLTGLEPWSVGHHPGAIYEQSSMLWFYGKRDEKMPGDDFGLERIANAPWPDKPLLISTVCSAKQQRHTLHFQRYKFTQLLKSQLPELQIFGHGHTWIADKADALDPYKYHVAIENHIAPHHWTEKLADAFLGHCLPLYFGAPRAADYFPKDALIALDLARPDWSMARIRDAIAGDEFTARKAAIKEARARIIHEHNIFPHIARIIKERGGCIDKPAAPATIHSRHVLRKNSPWYAVSHMVEKFLLTRRSSREQRRLVPMQ